MLDDKETIDQIVVRREALAAVEAAEAADLWQTWHDGRISTAAVEAIDRAGCRLTEPMSRTHRSHRRSTTPTRQHRHPASTTLARHVRMDNAHRAHLTPDPLPIADWDDLGPEPPTQPT